MTRPTAETRHGPRRAHRHLAWLGGLLVLAACGGSQDHGTAMDAGQSQGQDAPLPPDRDASLSETQEDAQPVLDGPEAELPDFLTALTSMDDVFAMLGQESDIKFLGTLDNVTPPVPQLNHTCLFQNTLRFPGHAPFLRSFPELTGMSFSTYLTMVMKRSSRVLWGGALRVFTAVPHPTTGADGILAYFLYSDPNDADALTDDEIVALDARMKSCVPFARDLLVLAGMDEDQATRFEAQRERLRIRGVTVLPAGQLRAGFSGEGYSLGESFGVLKLVPAGQAARDYSPRDLVVTEVAPAEMSAVAGLMTATAQDPQGQLNLSLQQGGIPNGQIPTVYGNGVLPLLAGRPVHILVRAKQIQIDPAPPPVARDFWRDHNL